MGKKIAYKKIANRWVVPDGGWNPDVYVMKADGSEPEVTYAGHPKKRRGRPTGSKKAKPAAEPKPEPAAEPTPEPVAEPTPEPAAAAPISAPDPAADAIEESDKIAEYLPDDGESVTYGENETPDAAPSDGGTATPPEWGAADESETPPTPLAPVTNPMAEVVVQSFLGIGVVCFGPDFAPANDAERETLVQPTSDYLNTLDLDNVPPWAVFVMAYGSYSAVKFAEPTVRERGKELLTKIRGDKPKKKKAAADAAPVAAETVPEADAEIVTPPDLSPLAAMGIPAGDE